MAAPANPWRAYIEEHPNVAPGTQFYPFDEEGELSLPALHRLWSKITQSDDIRQLSVLREARPEGASSDCLFLPDSSVWLLPVGRSSDPFPLVSFVLKRNMVRNMGTSWWIWNFQLHDDHMIVHSTNPEGGTLVTYLNDLAKNMQIPLYSSAADAKVSWMEIVYEANGHPKGQLEQVRRPAYVKANDLNAVCSNVWMFFTDCNNWLNTVSNFQYPTLDAAFSIASGEFLIGRAAVLCFTVNQTTNPNLNTVDENIVNSILKENEEFARQQQEIVALVQRSSVNPPALPRPKQLMQQQKQQLPPEEHQQHSPSTPTILLQLLQFLAVFLLVLPIWSGLNDPNGSESWSSSFHDTYDPFLSDFSSCDYFYQSSLMDSLLPQDYVFANRHHACLEELQDQDESKYSHVMNYHALMKMEAEKQRLLNITRGECQVLPEVEMRCFVKPNGDSMEKDGTIGQAFVMIPVEGTDLRESFAFQEAKSNSPLFQLSAAKVRHYFDGNLHVPMLATLLILRLLNLRNHSFEAMIAAPLRKLDLCILYIIGIQSLEVNDWASAAWVSIIVSSDARGHLATNGRRLFDDFFR